MEVGTLKNNLVNYCDMLAGIDNRFSKSRDGYDIDPSDDPVFKKLVLEVIDLLNDTLAENSYSVMIANHFNEGVSNFTGSPSLSSVRDVKTVIESLITRVEREGDSILKASTESSAKMDEANFLESTGNKTAMSAKERFEDHPVVFGLGLLVAGFVAGIATSDWLGRSVIHGQDEIIQVNNEADEYIAQQVESLAAEHDSRLRDLQAKLLENEGQSTYGGNLDNLQKKYKDAADRIRISIKEEN